jgi:hypothetical protein
MSGKSKDSANKGGDSDKIRRDSIFTRFPRDPMSLVGLLLIIFPPLLLAAYIKCFGVNMIYYDQWNFVPLLEKMYTGTLTFGDLFAQHNEHRIFFPRIIMLALAYVTHYSNIYEMYASWVLSLATFYLLLRRFLCQFKGTKYLLLAFAPVSWLFFNLNQYENILWGWQIQIYLAVLGFVASVFLLERSGKIDVYLALSLVSGIVASFSFINGLLVWPIGLIFIIITKVENRLKIAGVWSATGILALGAYFYQWTKPTNHPSDLYVLGHLDESAEYLLANLGSSISPVKYYAIVMGIVLSIIVILTLILVIRSKSVRENAFWIALTIFAVLSSFACMIGRAGFGIDQALSSRYITFTLLGVIGTYACLYQLTRKAPGNRAYLILYGMMLTLILASVIVGYPTGLIEGNNTMSLRDNCIATAHDYMAAGSGDTGILYPSTDLIKKDMLIMEKYRLNLFRYSQ